MSSGHKLPDFSGLDSSGPNSSHRKRISGKEVEFVISIGCEAGVEKSLTFSGHWTGKDSYLPKMGARRLAGCARDDRFLPLSQRSGFALRLMTGALHKDPTEGQTVSLTIDD